MQSASDSFAKYLNNVTLKKPQKALYLNTTGKHYKEPLITYCTNQITHPVKFYEMIETMINDGFDTFIECGPKNTLSNMVKKINKNVTVYNVDSIDTFEQVKKLLKDV